MAQKTIHDTEPKTFLYLFRKAATPCKAQGPRQQSHKHYEAGGGRAARSGHRALPKMPAVLEQTHPQPSRVVCGQEGPDTPPKESSIFDLFPLSLHFILFVTALLLHVVIL